VKAKAAKKGKGKSRRHDDDDDDDDGGSGDEQEQRIKALESYVDTLQDKLKEAVSELTYQGETIDQLRDILHEKGIVLDHELKG